MRRAFGGHTVDTAFERGWGALQNGARIEIAESSGFDMLVTTDKNLRYQQNLRGRRLAILILWTTSWPEILPHADDVAIVTAGLQPGEYRELNRPT